MQTVHTVRMVATSLLVMTGLVAGLLLVGLALVRRSRMSTTPHATSSGSNADSSWMYSGFSGSDSGHGGDSNCDPSDSAGTADAGCDSGGSDSGGGGDGGGGGGSD